MIVLGIDPGYALMGWGVVEAQGARMRLLGYGCVETQAGVPMQHRLRALQLGVRDLVNIYHPDDVAFEELFFARNVTTALMVGAARGAAIISAAEYTESLYEYTPMQIKQAVTGYGKADKKQIQQMVKHQQTVQHRALRSKKTSNQARTTRRNRCQHQKYAFLHYSENPQHEGLPWAHHSPAWMTWQRSCLWLQPAHKPHQMPRHVPQPTQLPKR